LTPLNPQTKSSLIIKRVDLFIVPHYKPFLLQSLLELIVALLQLHNSFSIAVRIIGIFGCLSSEKLDFVDCEEEDQEGGCGDEAEVGVCVVSEGCGG
jgi:hypothetical protein